MTRTNGILRRGLIGTALSFAGGLRAAPATDSLQVAQVVELTGAYSAIGDAWRNGVEMAAQEINAGGGLLGRLVQVMTFDAQSTAAGGHTAMTKALETDPLAVLGPALTEPARGALAVARGTRAILLGAGGADLTGAAHPCVFRTVPSDAAMMMRLAGWLRDAGHIRRLAIITSAQQPFRDAGEALPKAARATGIELAAEATMTTDLLAELPRLLHAAPDALAILLPAEAAGRFAAEVRRQAPKLMLIGGRSLLEPKAIDAAGSAAEGVRAHVLLADAPAQPDVQAFRDRFLARFKEPPSDPALAGYVALGAVRAAAEQIGAADPRALCEALHRLKPNEAQRRMLLGDGAWDAAGEIARPSWIVEIRSGRPVALQMLGS